MTKAALEFCKQASTAYMSRPEYEWKWWLFSGGRRQLLIEYHTAGKKPPSNRGASPIFS
jgi:hypothetical protein